MLSKKQRIEKTQSLKEEIFDLNNRLSVFGLSIKSLTSMTPSNKEDRKTAFEIINFISEDQSLINYVNTNKKLPTKMLVECLKIKKSFIRKNKVYIIGLLIMIDNKSSFLYEYIKDGLT